MNATDAAQHNAPTVGNDDKPGPPDLPTQVPPDTNGTRERQFIFLFP